METNANAVKLSSNENLKEREEVTACGRNKVSQCFFPGADSACFGVIWSQTTKYVYRPKYVYFISQIQIIWQFLGTFLVVTLGRGHFVARGDAGGHPQCPGQTRSTETPAPDASGAGGRLLVVSVSRSPDFSASASQG